MTDSRIFLGDGSLGIPLGTLLIALGELGRLVTTVFPSPKLGLNYVAEGQELSSNLSFIALCF